MVPDRPVGIVGYGAYIPRYRLPAGEIGRVWTDGGSGYPITEKSVPGPDEDTATMAAEAARNALARCEGLDPLAIRAVWVGSESHPYAVKQSGTVVAAPTSSRPPSISRSSRAARPNESPCSESNSSA